MLVDAHCHVYPEDYPEGVDEVVKRMEEADVGHALLNAVSYDTSVLVADLAKKHDAFFATAGVHPEDPEEREMTDEEFERCLSYEKCVAVGEIGLDYYWVKGDRTWQKERFARQLEIAKRHDLPAVIHTRDAPRDTLDILRESGHDKVQIHCCTEKKDFVKEALDLGFYISFTGIVTFKNAVDIQESCKIVPMDRLLVETDSPYLAPVPKRGKRNEPAYVRHVANFIANLKGVEAEEVEAATTTNFFRLFAKAKKFAKV